MNMEGSLRYGSREANVNWENLDSSLSLGSPPKKAESVRQKV